MDGVVIVTDKIVGNLYIRDGLPLEDKDLHWASIDQSVNVLTIASGIDIPEPNMNWYIFYPKSLILLRQLFHTKFTFFVRSAINKDITSNDVISAMAFAGLASHRLIKVGSALYKYLPKYIKDEATVRKQLLFRDFVKFVLFFYFTKKKTIYLLPKKAQNATFISDFDWMSGLEVRKGFEHYGATAFFDEKSYVLAIYWSHAHKTILPGFFFYNREFPGRAEEFERKGVKRRRLVQILLVFFRITRVGSREMGLEVFRSHRNHSQRPSHWNPHDVC